MELLKENLDQILVVADANVQKQIIEDVEPFQTYFFKIEIKHDEEVLVTSETLSFSTTLGYTVTLTTPEKDKEFFPNTDISFVWENTLATHEKYGAKFSYELHLSEDGKTYAAAEKDLLTEKHTLKNPFSAVGEHFWRIRTSFDNDTDTLFSEKGVFKTRNSPPSEPELKKPIGGNTVKAGNIAFEWTASEDGNKGDSITYALLIQEEGGTEETIATEISNTSYTHGGPLKDGKTFSWKIVATDPHGETAESDPASFQTFENKVPSKPVLPTTNSEGDTIDVPEKLTWGASDDDDGDAVSYIIFIDGVAVDTVETVEYTPEGLLGGRTYTWRVEAIDGNGGKASSGEFSFTTKNRVPSTPTLEIPQNNATDVDVLPTLTWSESTDPDGHNVSYTLTVTEDGEVPEEYTVQTNSYTFTIPLKKNITWSVVAIDSEGGESVSSNTFSFTPIKYTIVSITPDINAIAEDFVGRDDIITNNTGVDSTRIFLGTYQTGTEITFDVTSTPLGGMPTIERITYEGSEETNTDAIVTINGLTVTFKKIGVYEVFFNVEGDQARKGEMSYTLYVTSNAPDREFRNALSDINSSFITDDFLDTSQAQSKTDRIDVFFKEIRSLLGIEYFTHLKELNCYGNNLTSLDVSNLTSLTYLDCDNNALTSLDVSNLTNLTNLYCHENDLTNLDVSTLTSLTELYCYSNALTNLDVSNLTSLTGLSCDNNALTSLDVSNLTSLTYLDCDNNALTSLDVSNLTSLIRLDCRENDLTNLDVSTLTSLTTLDCRENDLTSLDVSTLTNLTDLRCQNNALTSLDVSNLTSLEYLYCYSNALTSLNVSNLTDLRELRCYENALTSLDVSNLTDLTRLYCYDNALISLNVSNLTDLRELHCYENALTSLDVLNLTDLTRLYCYDNALTSLDVSNLTNLTRLYCYDNALTSLDVSNLTNLIELRCSGNMLTTLDISSQSIWDNLNIYAGINSPNPQLSEIKAHEIQTCNSGIKDIFNQNKDTLEMKIISFDDDGTQVKEYDKTEYATECSP